MSKGYEHSSQSIGTDFETTFACGYRWIFVAGPFRSEIIACPGKEILMDFYKITAPSKSLQGFKKKDLANPEQFMLRMCSKQMDWVNDVINHIKELCH